MKKLQKASRMHFLASSGCPVKDSEAILRPSFSYGLLAQKKWKPRDDFVPGLPPCKHYLLFLLPTMLCDSPE